MDPQLQRQHPFWPVQACCPKCANMKGAANIEQAEWKTRLCIIGRHDREKGETRNGNRTSRGGIEYEDGAISAM